jgi:hypothetical protein
VTNQPSAPAPKPDRDVVAQFADEALLYDVAEHRAGDYLPDTAHYHPEPGEEWPEHVEILSADEIIEQLDGPDDGAGPESSARRP